MAKRLAGNELIEDFKRFAYAGSDKPTIDMEELASPLRLRKPARIGVQFMGDLFHESMPDKFIFSVFSVMAAASNHIFIVLTKRPERMKKIIEELEKNAHGVAGPIPCKNVWLGVSVEDQRTADERIPILLQTPAAVRFVSYEPALGPVDFEKIKIGNHYPQGQREDWRESVLKDHCFMVDEGQWDLPSLDWIVMGGETGPGARPIHPDWARSVRDQCKTAALAFYFKSWGEWRQVPTDTWGNYERVGSARSGRLIDGKEYNEVPT